MKKILFLVVALLCMVGSQVVAQTLWYKELWDRPAGGSYLQFSDDMNKLYQITKSSDFIDGQYINLLNPITGDVIDTLVKLKYTYIRSCNFLTDSLVLFDNFRTHKDSLGGLMLYNLYTKEYKYIDTGYGSSTRRYWHITYIPKNSNRILIEKSNSFDQFTKYFSVFDLDTWQTIRDTTILRYPYEQGYIVNYDMINDSLLLRATYNKGWDYGRFELMNIYTWKIEKSVEIPKLYGAVATLSKSRKYLDLGYGDPKLVIRTENLKLVSSIPNCMECYSAFFVKSDRYLIYKKGNVNIVYDMKKNEELGQINNSSIFDGFSENGEFAWWNTLKMFQLDWDNFSGKNEDIKSIDKLYPNPVKTGKFITIESNNTIENVSLFDLVGIEYKVNFENNIIHVPEDLIKGIYFIKYRENGVLKSRKIIVD